MPGKVPKVLLAMFRALSVFCVNVFRSMVVEWLALNLHRLEEGGMIINIITLEN